MHFRFWFCFLNSTYCKFLWYSTFLMLSDVINAIVLYKVSVLTGIWHYQCVLYLIILDVRLTIDCRPWSKVMLKVTQFHVDFFHDFLKSSWTVLKSFLYIFIWWIIDVRHKSPAGGRLKWGNVGLSSPSPPRKWKSMLDVTDGKLTSARASSPTKSSSPKTPVTVDSASRSGSNRRPSSPSPLRYGISILSWCFVMLPGALDVVLVSWGALLENSCARLNPFLVFCPLIWVMAGCGGSVWFVIV